jgi:soluble cytochrome b562
MMSPKEFTDRIEEMGRQRDQKVVAVIRELQAVNKRREQLLEEEREIYQVYSHEFNRLIEKFDNEQHTLQESLNEHDAGGEA